MQAPAPRAASAPLGLGRKDHLSAQSEFTVVPSFGAACSEPSGCGSSLVPPLRWLRPWPWDGPHPPFHCTKLPFTLHSLVFWFFNLRWGFFFSLLWQRGAEMFTLKGWRRGACSPQCLQIPPGRNEVRGEQKVLLPFNVRWKKHAVTSTFQVCGKYTHK